jgi:diacylglycerol kinase (ATP)
MDESMESKYSIKDNPHKGNKGLTRAIKASINSWNGLKYAFEEESAFRQELALAVLLIPTALLLIASVFLVLIVELLNSSVEAAIDRISFDIHGLSKRAKDFGSAAVMLALIVCLVTWLSVLFNTYLASYSLANS